ncbi:MAG: B12-binding domain-containing radical SAM protein [Cellulosilyticaceae bacterium]
MKVLLVSLNAKFIHSSLALRYIMSFCKKYKDNMELLELTINTDENDVIKSIYKIQPDVIGFSCYIWNMEQIETIIPILKQIMPNVKIVLGGPEVSYNSQALFKRLPIDIIMENEGEPIWLEYMEHLVEKTMPLSDISGILYRDSDGVVCETKKRLPMDMAKLPFVYDDLTGLEHKIMYYEASRGCPFNCQYCLSSVEKGVRFLPIERVKKELQYFLDHRIKQIKFVDRTFNTNKQYAKDIWLYIINNDNGHTNFHFEIAAELLDDSLLDVLKNAREGLIQFEIGVQSTNQEVLDIIKRPMPFKDIKEIVLKIKALGNIHQHLDLIAGLPKEDYASFKKSFNDVISLRPEQFQLGFLKLLKGSGLRKNAKQYGIVYKAKAPYEVLYTDHLSYLDMLKLHLIEELVERYYNSERFHTSLEYLYTLYKTPFDFYEALAEYWVKCGHDNVQHKKASYYIILVEFALQNSLCNHNYIKECMRLDWYSHENVKEMPALLQTIDQSIYKTKMNDLLRNDEWIENKVGIVSEISARQRLRRMHIEWFEYDFKTGDKCFSAYLFDYLQKPTRYYLTKELLDDTQTTCSDIDGNS